jgi:serine/threonine protein kinase
MAPTSKLGHFNLLEEIGHGGMGTIYRAFDPTLNREVAIKVLRENLARDPKFLNDFLREARSAAAISHPHIVQVHFVGQEASQYYIVMELLKGLSLREIIDKDGPLSEERALDVAIDVAEGLRAGYRNQMIHGDIKPANIFVTDDVGAKVLDFGLAKLANVEVSSEEGVWGSPYYISPERVGQKAEDFRSDVYSLGATLFHMLTGRPPFDAPKPEELAVKRLNEKPPLLRDFDPNITKKTEQVVNKMLNKSIMLRYRDYDALLEDIRDAKTEATAKRLGVDLHPELKPPDRAEPSRKSSLALVLTAVVAIIVIVAALAYVFWQRQPMQPAPPEPPKSIKTTTTTPKALDAEFTYTAPNAQSVFLAGNFNDWSASATPMRKRSDGVWTVTVPLKPGRYVYKLIVDDKWMPDPENPDKVPDDYGGYNSVVVVGQAAATGPSTQQPRPPPTPIPPKPPAAPAPPQTPAPSPAPTTGRLWDVDFTYNAPNARSVSLSGDFNNWSQTATPMHKRGDGMWIVTLPLRTGRHTYKFFVDGKWMADPENPDKVPDGYGGDNSVVVLGQ